MRSYSTIKPAFWLAQGEAKIIMAKYSEIEIMLYMYLLTSPFAHLSGIYQCPVIYIINETQLSAFQVEQGLKNLSAIDLVHVDPATDVVWIPRMLEHAAGRLSEADNRLKGVKSHLNTLPRCLLVDYFCEYNNIPPPDTKPLVSPLQAPTKGAFLSIPCNQQPDPIETPGDDEGNMIVKQTEITSSRPPSGSSLIKHFSLFQPRSQ